MSNQEGESQATVEREQSHDSYVQAARFATEQEALAAYAQTQEAIFAPTCDLSAYRFLLGTDHYVAVLGTRPSTVLAQSLQAILATGEAAELPDDIYQALRARREEAAREGQWVERHYRYGNRPKSRR